MHFTTTVDQFQLIFNVPEAQNSSARTGAVLCLWNECRKFKKEKVFLTPVVAAERETDICPQWQFWSVDRYKTGRATMENIWTAVSLIFIHRWTLAGSGSYLTLLPVPLPTGGWHSAACRTVHSMISIKAVSCLSVRAAHNTGKRKRKHSVCVHLPHGKSAEM